MKKKGGVGSLETCKVASKGCRWVEQSGGGGVPDEHGEDGWGEDSLEPARNTHAYVDPHGSDTPSLLSFLPAGFSPQGIMLVCAIL